jgi:hypothetical protein
VNGWQDASQADRREELDQAGHNATRLVSGDARRAVATASAANETMKMVLKTLAIAGMTVVGFVGNSEAQVQQNITFSWTVYNQNDDSSVRAVRVTTKDVIQNLAGTNMPGAKLWLVMSSDPSPDGGNNDNIGAFLRLTDSRGNVIVDTDTDMFNVYEAAYSQIATRTYAWNQFSFDFGGLSAELYGTAIWSRSFRSPGGQGSFHCSVSGHSTLSGITDGDMPSIGSISGGAPRPAS